MKPKMNATAAFLHLRIVFFSAIAATLTLVCGCGNGEKKEDPVVSVQTTPVKRAPISEVITVEAVVYPLEQATVAPKISSTIKKFYVQRGAPVKKGQLLAELENSDLSAAAEASKGDFEQAEASYATTVGSSLPQQIQKAELDATAAKSNSRRNKKFTRVARICFSRVRSRGAIWIPPRSLFFRLAARTNKPSGNLPTCSALEKSKLSNPRRARALRRKAE
jgi:multidrug efflux pump subunit AcrA (membrane-fusion protein)